MLYSIKPIFVIAKLYLKFKTFSHLVLYFAWNPKNHRESYLVLYFAFKSYHTKKVSSHRHVEIIHSTSSYIFYFLVGTVLTLWLYFLFFILFKILPKCCFSKFCVVLLEFYYKELFSYYWFFFFMMLIIQWNEWHRSISKLFLTCTKIKIDL